MIRVVVNDKNVVPDVRQRLPGRGAYVHHDTECIEKAVKRGGLARSLRCQVPAALQQALLGAETEK
jgi:uncharacterized protein